MAEGHRKRLLTRFEEENIDTIPDHIVIERLLQGVIYRKDTAEVARELLRKFGGISQIVDAPIEELKEVSGIGDAAASFIKFVPLFYRRYSVDKWGNPKFFDSPEKVAEYMRDKFIGYDHEVLIILCMDASCKMIACRPVCEGTPDAISVNIPKILKQALLLNATRIIIGHNHLNGTALPSNDDIVATEKIYTAFEQVGVTLDDHIIFADDDYVSLNDSGVFNLFRKPKKD